jgi:hypothetical protein
MKPRSRPPQKKKSAYFMHPNFSVAKLEKKSAQITQVNAVYAITDNFFTSILW